jgi:HEAT repeat protein
MACGVFRDSYLTPLTVWCIVAALAPSYVFAEPSVDEYLRQLASDDAQVRAKAAEALTKINPLPEEAIPALLKALDDQTPHSPERIYAARALANGGPKAGEAVKPRLLEKLREKDISSTTLGEVHSLYGAALPALCELLKDRKSRVLALGILSTMGQPASPAAPEVKQTLTDPDRNARLAGARCYWVLTGDTKVTIPVLIEGLQAPMTQSAHWSEAARSIGEIGPPAKKAVPLLVEMLQGTRESLTGVSVYIGPPFPWYHVRCDAAMALGRIGPDAKAAVKPLIAASKQADDRNHSAGPLRVRAARALWLIAPDHPEALSAVLRGLKESYPLNRIAIETVMAVGSPAKDAVPDLIAALASERLDTRQAAIDALGMIGAPASGAIPALQEIARLKELQDLRAAEHAQLAIARIGPPEQSAVPLVKLIVKSALDLEVRQIIERRLVEQK